MKKRKTMYVDANPFRCFVNHARLRPEKADQCEDVCFSQSLLGDALVGINFLGGMVKKLGEKLGDVDSMEASFKKGGQRLATAFEDAVSFITDDEETQRRPNETSSRSPAPSTPQKQADSAVPSTPSAFPATPGSTQTSTSTPSKAPAAAPTFSSLFEAKLGSVHLQTLENLSMQSSLQLQQIVRKLTPEQRDIVTKQQDELRAIYAPDVTETPMDLEHLALPAHVPDTLKSQLIALHQKCSNFYASRTASLQGFAIKAIDEFVLPVDNDLKTFSDLALSYRGKLQLEGLRQLAEFCAMAVGFVLQYAETITQAFKENPAMDLIEHARLIHGIALTIKVHAWAIVTPIIAAMKALGNSYRAKVPNLEADPNAKTAAQATLKRFTTGINNLQLDSATATSSVLDASRFTLAIIQHLHAQVVPQPEQSI